MEQPVTPQVAPPPAARAEADADAPSPTAPAVGAASAAAPALARTPASGDALGVAVFGAGIIAQGAHFHALSLLAAGADAKGAGAADGCVRVRAVWSRTSQHASTLAARYGSSVSWHVGDEGVADILARPDVHAAVLAVPIAELSALGARCRAAGLHVLSEKPVAHSVAAARDALLARAPARALYAVAENFRFEAGVVAAAADAARLNPVCISLTAAMHMPPESHFATSWRLRPRHVGAQLLDGGVHFVAAMRMAARSDVVRVCAAASTASMHLPNPDSASAMLQFANGVHGTLLISYAAMEFVWEMRVIATDGDLCLRRVKGKPGYTLETRHAGKTMHKSYPFCGIDEEFKCFVQCCRSGTLDPRLSPACAFNDLATIEAIVQSADTGMAVTVARLYDNHPTPPQ
eukprot:IDg22531t1